MRSSSHSLFSPALKRLSCGRWVTSAATPAAFSSTKGTSSISAPRGVRRGRPESRSVSADSATPACDRWITGLEWGLAGVKRGLKWNGVSKGLSGFRIGFAGSHVSADSGSGIVRIPAAGLPRRVTPTNHHACRGGHTRGVGSAQLDVHHATHLHGGDLGPLRGLAAEQAGEILPAGGPPARSVPLRALPHAGARSAANVKGAAAQEHGGCEVRFGLPRSPFVYFRFRFVSVFRSLSFSRSERAERGTENASRLLHGERNDL
eukprot:1194850-Prorocentrum_minimum.AAC.2